MSAGKKFRAFCQWYESFVSKQGFTVLTLLCVAVITATALWTKNTSIPHPVPTPPVSDAASAARLMQQSLREASTPSPAPTAASIVWTAPLEHCAVLVPFDSARLQQSAVTGMWSVHDAVDLAAGTGDIVRSMGDGVVVSVTDDQVAGKSVTIRHGDGYTVEYGALSLIAALQADDPVQAGQTIGFAGSSLLAESDQEAHLHLRVMRNGTVVDPMLLLRQLQ